MAINLLKINAEAVLCTGDLHGNLNSIGYHIKQFGIQNSVLICCGDIGLGFNIIPKKSPSFRWGRVH